MSGLESLVSQDKFLVSREAGNSLLSGTVSSDIAKFWVVKGYWILCEHMSAP